MYTNGLLMCNRVYYKMSLTFQNSTTLTTEPLNCPFMDKNNQHRQCFHRKMATVAARARMHINHHMAIIEVSGFSKQRTGSSSIRF